MITTMAVMSWASQLCTLDQDNQCVVEVSPFHAPIILRGTIGVHRLTGAAARSFRDAVVDGRSAGANESLFVVEVEEVMRGSALAKQVFIRMRGPQADGLLEDFIGREAIFFLEPDRSIPSWQDSAVLHLSPNGMMHSAVYRHLAPETSQCGGVASVDGWPVIAMGPLSEAERRVLSPYVRSMHATELDGDFITSLQLLDANEQPSRQFDCTMYTWPALVGAVRERAAKSSAQPPVVLGRPGEFPKNGDF